MVKHGGDTSHQLKIGQQGTVVTIASTSFVGVSWDGLKTGHNMNGKLSDKSGWGVAVDLLQLVVEEAKPEPEKPSIKPAKPKPWFALSESSIDELLEMSFEFKPASEMFSTAALGNWTAQKPQEADSKPKPKPKKKEEPLENRCWKCAKVTVYGEIFSLQDSMKPVWTA